MTFGENNKENYVEFNLNGLLAAKGVVKNNVISIFYATSYGPLTVNFTIFSGKKIMNIETNIESLTIPFIPGTFKFPSEDEALFNTNFSITNLDWNYFKKDANANSSLIKELPIKYVEKEKWTIEKVKRVNDRLIVGVSSEQNYNSIQSFLISNDNGLTWKGKPFKISNFNNSFYSFKDITIDNDSVYYILCLDRVRNKAEIIRTQNGGTIWNIDTLLSSLNTISLFFLNDKTGIALTKQNNKSILYIKKSGSSQWKISGNEINTTQFDAIRVDVDNKIFLIKHSMIYENYTYKRKDVIYTSSDYGAAWKQYLVSDTCRFNLGTKTITGANSYSYAYNYQQKQGYFCYQDRSYDLYSLTYKEHSATNNKTVNIILGYGYIYLSRNQGKSWKYIPFLKEIRSNHSDPSRITANNLIFLNKDKILLINRNSISIASIKDF